MAPAATQSIHRSRTLGRQVQASWLTRVNSRFFGLGMFVMMGLIFMALLHTWFEIQVVNLGYGINKQMAIKDDLTQQIKILSLDVARLRSPNRIETMAVAELGMSLPTKQQMVFMSQLGNGETGISLAQLASGQIKSVDEMPDAAPDQSKVEPVKVAQKTEKPTVAPVKAKPELKVATKQTALLKKTTVPLVNKTPLAKPVVASKPVVNKTVASSKAPVTPKSLIKPKTAVMNKTVTVVAKKEVPKPVSNLKLADNSKNKVIPVTNKTASSDTKRIVPAAILKH